MDELPSGELVAAVGTYLYDGMVECNLRIVRSETRYGSGDHEDPADLASDRQAASFYVDYGSTTKRGEFNARSSAFPTLDAALAATEKLPGIGHTVCFRSRSNDSSA